ncbi:MAG: ATP-binding protein [Candidatus Sabulitectum sp.]|nr:ATP-binding protein [Candidatus Sabulitectum sp.]
MIIAVASGKGGTGKTTVAVALSMASSEPVLYADCDVEEPNGSIFLRPEVTETEKVLVEVPRIDEGKCTSCGKCARFCQFNALVSLGSPPLVFPELCHSCGGCEIVCPTGAVSWKKVPIGEISLGTSDGGRISVLEGRLDVGSSLAPPVIRQVKSHIADGVLTIIDCPPGTSCPVIESLGGADYVLLVTEPTPFGLHDLKLAVETVRELGMPFSVVINRFDEGDSGVEDYCGDEKIHIIVRIPHKRFMAEVYSRGGNLFDAIPEMREIFSEIPRIIEKGVEVK